MTDDPDEEAFVDRLEAHGLRAERAKILVDDDADAATDDAERLTSAEPTSVPADAARDENGEAIFPEGEICISEDAATVCRMLASAIRAETVQFVAGATAATDGPGSMGRRVSLDALAQHLAGCAAAPEADVDDLRIALHHTHLQTLHSANAVRYDPDAGEVAATLETDSYARLATMVTTFVEGAR